MNISRNVEECTCCADVFKLLDCTNPSRGSYRGFALYKTRVYGDRNDKEISWSYYLLIEEDFFPIVITEEIANKILKDPEYGGYFVTNHWFCRWR